MCLKFLVCLMHAREQPMVGGSKAEVFDVRAGPYRNDMQMKNWHDRIVWIQFLQQSATL